MMESAKFKIKITKCSHPMFWYNSKVGQIVSVIDSSVRDYYVKCGETPGCILLIDAEILK